MYDGMASLAHLIVMSKALNHEAPYISTQMAWSMC